MSQRPVTKDQEMAEEDAELKELVIQSLESNGVLAQIRAQLRASVFLALDEANTLQKKKPLANKELQKYLETENGQLVASLVREFLLYFNLDATLSVYESESSVGRLYYPKDSGALRQTLGFDSEEGTEVPLIDVLATKYLEQFSTPNPKPTSVNTVAIKEPKPDYQPETEAVFSINKDSNDDESVRDPFFDDPLPNEIDNFQITSLKSRVDEHSDSQSKKHEVESDSIWNSPFVTRKDAIEKINDNLALMPETKQDTTFTISLGSLKDAPPLFEPKGKLPPLWVDTGSANHNLETKPRGLQDHYDYDEDFQSSASIRSDQKTGTEHSIEEDIEENFSGTVDDLLSNEGISEGDDDTTTDHTISNIGIAAADYLES